MKSEAEYAEQCAREIVEYREEFAKIDHSKPEQLKAWFEKYSYLTNQDQAQIARVSSWRISAWKKKLGVSKRNNVLKQGSNRDPTKISTLNSVPDNWRTYEWLSVARQKYTLQTIANAAGCSIWYVSTLCKSLGLGTPHKTHKCCNREWCYRHYVLRELSARACAKLAGVATETFLNWLNKFEIRVRPIGYNFKYTPMLWAKTLDQKLSNLDELVNKVYLRRTHIHVRYRSFMWETYYVKEISNIPPFDARFSFLIEPDDTHIRKIPAVTDQYEFDLSGQKFNHVQVKKKDFEAATFMERRLAIQSFVQRITYDQRLNGWQGFAYPERILIQEREHMLRVNTQHFIGPDEFYTFPSVKCRWRRLIEHFADIEADFTPIVRSPFRVWQSVRHLLNHRRVLNTHNMLRSASSVYKTRLYNPMFFGAIFKKLGIRQFVDLSPGYCSKFIGAAATGVDYYAIRDSSLERAEQLGIANFMGYPLKWYNNEPVEWGILDNNFKKSGLEQALQYADKVKRLLVFVPASDIKQVIEEYEPEAVLKVNHNPPKMTVTRYDYLVVL